MKETLVSVGSRIDREPYLEISFISESGKMFDDKFEK
jgi:hypothetical protein